MTPICVTCMIEMKVANQNTLFVSMGSKSVLSSGYCDIYQCDNCKAEVIFGAVTTEHSLGWVRKNIIEANMKNRRVIFFWLNLHERKLYMETALLGEQEEIPF